jgi:hypothetical protein
MWAQSYEHEPADLLTLQAVVARQVTRDLALALSLQ